MSYTALVESLGKAKAVSAANYSSFIQALVTHLQGKGKSVIISPVVCNNKYTLRFVYQKNNKTTEAETMPRPDLFAARLTKLNVARIIFASGVREEDINGLINRCSPESSQGLHDFNRPNIAIEYKQAGSEARVLSLDPPTPRPVITTAEPPTPDLADATTRPEESKPTGPKKYETIEELLSEGQRLKRTAIKKGLSQELRTEIIDWLDQAKTRIDSFLKDIADHWTQTMIDKRFLYCKTADLYNNLKAKLDIKEEPISIPYNPKGRPTRKKQDNEQKPERPDTEQESKPKRPPQRPDEQANPYVDLLPSRLYSKCHEVRYGLQCSVPLANQIPGLRKLASWLRYLLYKDNFEKELGSGNEGYKDYFTETLRQIRNNLPSRD